MPGSGGFLDVAARYGGSMVPYPVCDGAGDTDHYAFWVAGIPAYVIEEWGSENNPHYDDAGGDAIGKISFANLDFAHDEVRQSTGVRRTLTELAPVRRDGAVEHRLLGLVTLVRARRATSTAAPRCSRACADRASRGPPAAARARPKADRL